MRTAPVALIAAVLVVGLLSGCAGSDPYSPTRPDDALRTVSTGHPHKNLTLVVRVAGSDLPGAPRNNHPSPAKLVAITQPRKCRAWITNPVNYGGWVTGELHLLLPSTRGMTLKTKIEALRGVTSVVVEPASRFDVRPTPRPVHSNCRATW